MESEKCPCCEGKGRTLQAWEATTGNWQWQADGDCPRCYGSGYIWTQENPPLTVSVSVPDIGLKVTCHAN